ncbi:hypothetical protein LOY86_001379 [Ophidiomyces ophidiicola]|nr:hypothetical protein LOZ60_004137 [Ophidiomyces ophidiicola]KAI2010382.1 hypothetical protein LOZ49_003498 [Ophidiomyces ophidiicola]KAI2018097.1 hypothetical protein LOZ46_004127 [Ophidiomyces ophidiicola]KAI2134315.1 hypothetical protein LOZ28_005019 [Ophidiomyces ophidiicola]KAI2136717.1 hypothetical protein LOZ29_003419 [Ophidiomyces ophidiicola]
MAIRFSRPPPPRRSRRLRVVIVGCFLALLLAFITIRNTWFPPPPLPIPPASEDIPRALVLAKTRWENVQWAHRLRPQWIPFVYSIDKEPGFPLRLPANRGREAMAYLTFIIDNYDTLPEITAFVHAKNYQWHNDGAGSRTAAILKNLYMSTVERKGYVNLRCNPDPGCPTAISPFSPTAEDIRTGDVRAHFPEVYMALLNVTRKEVPKRIGSVCCAQFALSRDRIRLRPRDDYIRMREWALTADFDSQTIGWVFEMIWHIIFKEDAVLCPSRNQLEEIERCPIIHDERQPGIRQLYKIPIYRMRDTPLRSLYRLYEDLCASDFIMLGYECTYFFHHSEPSWSLACLPDPQDNDPVRYFILASMVEALVEAFNCRLELGIRRDNTTDLSEERSSNFTSEKAPSWTSDVTAVTKTLVFCEVGSGSSDMTMEQHFLKRNIKIPNGYFYTV